MRIFRRKPKPKKENEPLKLEIGNLLSELPVIERGQLEDYRKRITTVFPATPHPPMFSGSTNETIEFVIKMVQQTEKYILSCEGMTKVRKSFVISSWPVSTVLEIQYDQYWEDGSSAIYSEHVMRTGDDQFEVFGSEKSGARMATVWSGKDNSEKTKNLGRNAIDEPDKELQVNCLRCGILLLTEAEVKRKYPMRLFVGTMDDLAQIERDRNAIGVTCAVCGRSFCSACMLKSGKPHPKSGGLACLECGGHMTHFKGS